MTGLPFGLRLYRLAMAVLAPFAPLILRFRVQSGKEDAARVQERLGGRATDRPPGLLVWIHGASVGESLVALNVARALLARRPDVAVLLTSGTVTSATLIAKAGLASVRHRFVPIDTHAAVSAFLDGWRPDLAILVESELWPNLILGASERDIPLALVNGRMNVGSVRKWSRMRGSARALLGRFALLQAVDSLTADALSDFTDRLIPQTGNLKLAAPRPEIDKTECATLRAVLGTRPVWLTASTHLGEEAMIAEAHAILCMASPSALLILAPRHPDRALALQVQIRKAGLTYAVRSQGGIPDEGIQVWLWDTLGELGLAYALAPVSLVAGSLVDGIGGHNPVEPAHLGSAIITGPFVASFADLVAAMQAKDALRMIDIPSAQAVALNVAMLWGDVKHRNAMMTAARACIANGEGALDDSVDAVLGLLPSALS